MPLEALSPPQDKIGCGVFLKLVAGGCGNWVRTSQVCIYRNALIFPLPFDLKAKAGTDAHHR